MSSRQALISEFYGAVVLPGSASARASKAFQALIRLGEACGYQSEYSYEVAKAGLREVASEGDEHAAMAIAMYGILNAGYDHAMYCAHLLAQMGTSAALAGLEEMTKKLRGEIWGSEIARVRDAAVGR